MSAAAPLDFDLVVLDVGLPDLGGLEVLAKIAQAEAVRVTFRYDNGQVIDLPLNEPDLAYWKAQL